MRWIKRTQSSFSESFFPVFNWKYSFFTIASMGFQVSLIQFHKNSLSKTLLEGKAVTMRWIKRTQSSFSVRFFPVFNWRYFLFHHSPLWASKYHFASSARTTLAKGSFKESCNSVRWIHRRQSHFLENFFPVFNGGSFLFHQSPLWASKYRFANSTRTALAKGFLKGKL